MATYNTLPKNTPKILRDAGLKVVVVPGWRRRKTNSWQEGFDPVGVLCHHTATSVRALLATVLRLLVGGRSDLSGPLCNFGLGRDGTVYLIAAGRANHAGTARSSGTVASGDGNYLYIGIEAFNDGVGESWPAVQYNAYVLLAAVLSVKITKSTANTVRGHKETSVTGKIDPTFDMDDFRVKVAFKMDELENPHQAYTRGARIDHALQDLRKANKKAKSLKGVRARERAKHVQAAIAALKLVRKAKVNNH